MDSYYYRDQWALVTGETFEVRAPRQMRFRLRELRSIQVISHDRDATVSAARRHVIGALVFLALSRSDLVSVESWIIAGLLVAAPVTVVIVCLRMWPKERELTARYHGDEVLLYSSYEDGKCEQVEQAVRLALSRN